MAGQTIRCAVRAILVFSLSVECVGQDLIGKVKTEYDPTRADGSRLPSAPMVRLHRWQGWHESGGQMSGKDAAQLHVIRW